MLYENGVIYNTGYLNIPKTKHTNRHTRRIKNVSQQSQEKRNDVKEESKK